MSVREPREIAAIATDFPTHTGDDAVYATDLDALDGVSVSNPQRRFLGDVHGAIFHEHYVLKEMSETEGVTATMRPVHACDYVHTDGRPAPVLERTKYKCTRTKYIRMQAKLAM